MRESAHITIVLGAAVIAAIVVGQSTAHATQPRLQSAVAQGVDGKEVYLKNCKECHGVLGAPTKASLRKYDKIPDFTDSSFFKSHTHEKLLEVIDKGKGRDMKGFGDKLSKEEMKAVMEYIHTLQKK